MVNPVFHYSISIIHFLFSLTLSFCLFLSSSTSLFHVLPLSWSRSSQYIPLLKPSLTHSFTPPPFFRLSLFILPQQRTSLSFLLSSLINKSINSPSILFVTPRTPFFRPPFSFSLSILSHSHFFYLCTFSASACQTLVQLLK